MLKIGTVIKQLRQEQGITQEKLADHLGLSAQSISKWENGLSYPDITLIPAIALFFNVSTDELFSLNHSIDSQRLIAYEKNYQQLRAQGAIREQIVLCRQMLLDYPRNYTVMQHLADALMSCYLGLDENRQVALDHHYLEEAIKIYEHILNNCLDQNLRLLATQSLCQYYPELGQTEKALSLVCTLPSISGCKDILLEDILSGQDCIHQEQLNILQLTDRVAELLIRLCFTKHKCIPDLPIDQRIQFIHTSNQLYHLMIPDANYLYFHARLAWNYRRLAELYLIKKEPTQALAQLQLAFEHALAYDQLPDQANYTSPFISSCAYDKKELAKNWNGSECQMLYYRLTTHGTFDDLQDNPAFQVLVDQLALAIDADYKLVQ